MPQVKEPLLRRLVKKALHEAELTAGPENTTFNIKVDLGNPQSETKLGLRIQLRPKEGFLEPDKKGELEATIMTKMNNSLEQFNIQISKDTDVPDPEVMGFFIPLPQLKNMIVSALKGPGASQTDTIDEPSIGGLSKTPSPLTQPPAEDEEITEQEDPLDRASRLAKEPIDKWKTGLSLKRSGYSDETGGELPIEELFEKITIVKELLVDIFKDIYKSDYGFRDYYVKNEDQITRTQAIISMIHGDLEDRLEDEEPVGPDSGIEELKKVIKKLVKEHDDWPVSNIKDDAGTWETGAKDFEKWADEGGDRGKGLDDADKIIKDWREKLYRGYNDTELETFSMRMAEHFEDYCPKESVSSKFTEPLSEKTKLNEMLVRELKQISRVVIKEDFYNFINAGQNVLRTLEENGMEKGKKYLEYLVRHNIM